MSRNSIFSKFVSFCFDVKTSNSKLSFYSSQTMTRTHRVNSDLLSSNKSAVTSQASFGTFLTSKKGISPVVATALLLVIAVVAVVGFQGWFGTYSSGVFSNVEVKSNSAVDGTLKIEQLVGNTLYVINNVQDNLSIGELKIGGNICTITNNLTLGMNEIPVSSCTSGLTISNPDIVLITDKTIVSKTVYLKNTETTTSSSLDCSTLNGGEWILVPGNGALGTRDFCVMKYEAKNVGGIATSQASTTPWGDINQENSRIACENLGPGSGYGLITNAQWTTIARNAENNGINWDSGIIGTGSMYRGHSDGFSNELAASTNDNDGYFGTGDLAPSNQKRTLNLSNGEIIWDLGGNLWEWTNDTCSQGDPWYNSGWREWTHSDVNGPEKNLAGPDGNYDSSNGIGRYYGCDWEGNAFVRGGHYGSDINTGIFALVLDFGPSIPSGEGVEVYGFRCSFTQ